LLGWEAERRAAVEEEAALDLVFGICLLAIGFVAGLDGLLTGLTRKGLQLLLFTMGDLVMSGNLATTDEGRG
jgi:hypothetical protein